MPAAATRKRSGTRYMTNGRVVSAFFQAALRHTQGEWAGKPFVPTEWQNKWLDEAFLLDSKTGLRVYRTQLLGVPAKNGKTETAQALGLYALTQDHVDGKLEDRAEIIGVAKSRKQAGVWFDGSCEMANASPFLTPGLDVQKARIWNPRNKGVLRALAAEEGATHGYSPSWIVCDEIHAWSNRKLLTVLQKSRAARRQATTTVITHTGWDRYGPLGEMYDALVAHPKLEVYGDKKGEPALMIVRDREGGVLFWWYGWRDGMDPEDPKVWAQCNPSPWVNEEFLRQQLAEPGASIEDFIRFHLNGWVLSSEGLLRHGEWAALADPEMVIPRGAPVFIGIDAARKDDYGAAVLCQPVLDGDEVRYRLLPYTLRPDATNPNSMLRRIENLIYELARRYDIREVCFDPYIFTRSADDLASEGFEMVEFPQSDVRMAIATERFREHVRRRLLIHDGDRDLSEQVSNAIVRDVQRGRGQRIDKSAQKAKIDACVAAAMAVDAAVNAVNRGDVGPGGEVQILQI